MYITTHCFIFLNFLFEPIILNTHCPYRLAGKYSQKIKSKESEFSSFNLCSKSQRMKPWLLRISIYSLNLMAHLFLL